MTKQVEDAWARTATTTITVMVTYVLSQLILKVRVSLLTGQQIQIQRSATQQAAQIQIQPNCLLSHPVFAPE